MFAYYSTVLSKLYEPRLRELSLERCVLAYRRFELDGAAQADSGERRGGGKCNIHFAKEVFDTIHSLGECSVIALDVEGFFDNIDHLELKEAWCRLLGQARIPSDHYAVYKAITRYAAVRRPDLYARLGIGQRRARSVRGPLCSPSQFRSIVRDEGRIEINTSGKGIPQGSPISALLSNLFLLGFDEQMARRTESCGGLYRRYSDDIIIVCPRGQQCCETIADDALGGIGLSLSASKSEVARVTVDGDGRCRIDKPVQYLGFVYDGTNVALRHRSLARFQRRMKRAVRLSLRTHRCARRGLYGRFTHLGGGFPQYVLRSGRILASDGIRRLNKRLWRQLHRLIWRK